MERIDGYQVKRALQVSGAGAPREVSARLGIADEAGKLQVRNILRSLKQRGAVWRDESGRYHLGDDFSLRPAVQVKLWEFMALRFTKAQPWTTREAAKRALCSWDYAKRYVTFLCEAGFVESVGKTGKFLLYRVAPGREKETPPHWNRRAEKRKGQGLGVGGQEEIHCACEAKPDGGRDWDSCRLWGRVGCEGFPQECERCDLQAAPDFPENRKPEIENPIINCGCPGDTETCAQCLEMEGPQAGQDTGWKPALPDVGRAGEIIAEMEETLEALGGCLEVIGGHFRDLRGALGLAAPPPPQPSPPPKWEG